MSAEEAVADVAVTADPAVRLFGQLVLRQRRARNWPVRELRERSGVAINRISRIERGLGDIWLSNAVKLANALDIELCDLQGGAPCPHCGNCPLPGYTCNTCYRGESS